MAVLNMVQALNQTLKQEMERLDEVVVLGEDVGKNGGVFRVTDGLWAQFGESRVMDTPLAESGIIGVAIGMALYGLKPIAEIQFLDFLYPGFDQVVNELAKFRYRSGGQYPAPVVIRTPYGGGVRGGHYHSQSTEAFFIHTAGLRVVIPSTPYTAKGLLTSAIRSEDPVVFLEPKRSYFAVKEEVPEQSYTLPLDKGRLIQEGKDVTLITYGAMLQTAKEAVEVAREFEYSVELIDLLNLVPFDVDLMMESVKKTGRVVILNEAARMCGFAAEMAAQIAERGMEYLEAPIKRVTGFDTPIPYSLEHVYLPDAKRVFQAIKEVMEF